MVYGDSHRVQNETDPVDTSLPDKSRRLIQEQRVLQSPDVIGTVVRPGWVYGKRQGGWLANWWFKTSDVEIFGNPERAYSFVHADDLGEAYALIAEAPAGNVAGEVFNIVDNNRYNLRQVAAAASRAAGFTGEIKIRPSEADWEHYFDRTVLVDFNKAERLLGWRPRPLGFVDEIEKHYRSFKTVH
eukprot:TRINITY_DN149_c0_g1_i1.p1 TRINITY_DN149_c0_g1~~TRINITY_DN149_c0_g1_i1.p1  ORF type:complete len:186 (+),score=36.18 TRINITY_DN149_c0_g1_i1:792-1349(+)